MCGMQLKQCWKQNFIAALSAYIGRKGRPQVSNLYTSLKKLEEKEENKPKASKRK